MYGFPPLPRPSVQYPPHRPPGFEQFNQQGPRPRG
jgi:hypothetical protein